MEGKVERDFGDQKRVTKVGPRYKPLLGKRFRCQPKSLDAVALAHKIGIRETAKVRWLRNALNSFPDVVASFQLEKSAAEPSKIQRRLERMNCDPERLIKSIVDMSGHAHPDGLRQAVQKDDALARVFYQFAELLPPENHAEQHINDGTAFTEFFIADQSARVASAMRTVFIKTTAEKTTGKGGPRRSTERDFINHSIDWILELYHDITQKVPGYSTNRDGSGLSGPAITLLRASLESAGLKVSDATVKRRIQDFCRIRNLKK